MNLRPLGRSGIAIAPLMLGSNVFGWNVDQKTSAAILDAFIGRQQRGFGQSQVACMFAEVILRSGFESIRSPSQIDLVCIQLKDLLLGKLALNLH